MRCPDDEAQPSAQPHQVHLPGLRPNIKKISSGSLRPLSAVPPRPARPEPERRNGAAAGGRAGGRTPGIPVPPPPRRPRRQTPLQPPAGASAYAQSIN